MTLPLLNNLSHFLTQKLYMYQILFPWESAKPVMNGDAHQKTPKKTITNLSKLQYIQDIIY
ncbi:hypothetical protein HYC85_009932 [Camellia sinensis]|uniref:Uncharacterized protein n=1 Tax=Camellia sinensis TaxID=4442 RepID=A0A7J7HJ30_CAMSI|nr:hypothetical protein HYC85_009932 [Camellia sinensis]